MSEEENEMNTMIDAYIHNCIEPPYNGLYYTDYYRGRINYSYDVTNKIIRKRKEELNEQIKRLDNFQYLIIKHSFPSKYDEYLFELLKAKNNIFYEIMNNNCEYLRGIKYPLEIPLWNEDNIPDKIDNEYCTMTPTGLMLCENCKHFLLIIQNYKKSITV